MDTKALMWVILGVILILAGITSSLREGRSTSAPSAERAVTVPRESSTLFAGKPEEASPPPRTPAASAKKIDTGFDIDPIRGLRRKDQNEEYFK